MSNTCRQRSKYDMETLLGADTCALQQPASQHLPTLAFVLQQTNGCVSIPPSVPTLSTQTVKQEPGLSVKAPEKEAVDCKKTTKRRASEYEGEKDARTIRSLSTKKCRGKLRKPTYLIRKEEKYELLEHIKKLENQVSFLQNRTSILSWQEKDRQQIETEIENNVLRDLVKQHQLRVLSAQSALSELAHSVNNRCPLETYIHLDRDWAKRTETLSSLRSQQCRDAAELVEKRTQFMTEARGYTESDQFIDEAGDFCSIRFDITPLEGLKTVKEAFEFLKFHIKHMDTKPMNSKYSCTSELGTDKNILHRRLIISEVENVATETNFVLFSEQRAGTSRQDVCGGNADKSCDQGIMVMNFVDKDDLYPYRPQNCVRLDINSVLALKSYRKLVKTPEGGEMEVAAVVLTRWMSQKLRRTELPVSKHVMQTMRERIDEPGNAILRAVKDARTPVRLELKDIKVLSV